MTSGFIVRLRPTGPWRLGPSSGARDRVDRVLHSDTLYSALTIAADHSESCRIGLRRPLRRRNQPSALARVSFRRPDASGACAEARVAACHRSKTMAGGRFVPLHVIPRLLAYESLKEDRWAVDPVSESVFPSRSSVR